MDYADHYEVDDSDVEAVMPPRNLLQQAREILARPVTQQELARAWDRSNHLPSEDQRVAACLEKLLMQSAQLDEGAARSPAPATTAVQAPSRRASPSISAAPSRQMPRDVVDLSVDDTPPSKHSLNGSHRKRSCGEAFPEVETVSRPKVQKVAIGENVYTRGPKEPKNDAVPQWLLQQFEAVAAAPAAAPIPAVSAPPSTTPALPHTEREPHPAQEQHMLSTTAHAPAEDPIATPEEEPNALAQILAIIPDVDVEYAQRLMDEYGDQPATGVEQVIDALLSDNSYPRAQTLQKSTSKGKGKAESEDDLLTRLKAYLDKDTRARTERIPSFTYREAALEYLFEEFPSVPLPFIRNIFADNNLYWAPTFVELTRMSKEVHPMYRPLKTARKSKGKGAAMPQDEVLTTERDTYFAKVAQDQAENDAKVALQLKEDEELARGDTYECGCCFDDILLSKMVACSEAHLFCVDCARKNAEHTLGNRGSEITCMDQDGCPAPFADEVLSTFLKTPQMLLLEKIRSEKAVEAAGLAGLSYCPHCSFGCVIDNPDEKLFYCFNEECKKITCRQCQKPDHLPKTCDEYAADLKTDTIHRVEEAMTEALLKRCPHCTTPVLKEDGCNKMRCSKCTILFCYVCSKKISGYEHFDQRSLPASSTSNDKGKCPLWDDTQTRQYEEVEAARARAVAAIREEKGDPDAVVSEEELTKLGLKKPEPRHPGQYYVGAPPAANGAYEYQYRFPLPAGMPGGEPRIDGHNAILRAVGGDWHAYAAEVVRVRDRINQGDRFAGEGQREDAARLYAAYYRDPHRRRVEGPLPAPVLVRVPRDPARVAAPLIHPPPVAAPAPARRPVPAVAPPKTGRRVRGV